MARWYAPPPPPHGILSNLVAFPWSTIHAAQEVHNGAEAHMTGVQKQHTAGFLPCTPTNVVSFSSSTAYPAEGKSDQFEVGHLWTEVPYTIKPNIYMYLGTEESFNACTHYMSG